MTTVRKFACRVAATMFLGCWLGLPTIAFAQSQQPGDYLLHAGDDVEVAVWKEVDLLRKVVIRPDGKFTFPLAGEILAEGRTVEQIRRHEDALVLDLPVIPLSHRRERIARQDDVSERQGWARRGAERGGGEEEAEEQRSERHGADPCGGARAPSRRGGFRLGASDREGCDRGR